jgi:hypothetical protein
LLKFGLHGLAGGGGFKNPLQVNGTDFGYVGREPNAGRAKHDKNYGAEGKFNNSHAIPLLVRASSDDKFFKKISPVYTKKMLSLFRHQIFLE